MSGFVRSVPAALALGLLAATACGGRTSSVLDGDGGDTNGTGNATGTGDSSGNGGDGGGGTAGRPNTGGRGGSGGRATGGAAGGGGFGAVPGGFMGAGGNPDVCAPPFCACGDCTTNCVCQGYDKQYCYDSCFGAGGFGGVGGFSGTGGTTMGCAPEFCSSEASQDGNFTYPGCCLADGSCGLSTQQLSSLLSVEGGCQPYSQLGFPSSDCPIVLGPLPFINTPCCRAEGVCGVELGSMGCVRRSPSLATKCVPGGVGGFPGSGGTGAGGAVPPPTGGTTSVDQCLKGANTDCERCVCKSCDTSFDSCYADAGCPYILQCAVQTGCTGINCYQPNTCGSVIDRYGGIGGPSVNLALPLFSCARTCNCGFQ